MGHFRGGDKRWDFQCTASSDHSSLHSSFLRSSLAPFSRLTLHLSLKTPAAVGGEREGGKGGGGGRGWGRQVCQSFHPPVAIPFLCFPLIQRFILLYIFTLGRYISPPGVETCYHRSTFPSIFFLHYIIRSYLSLELLCEPLSSFIHPSRYNPAFYCVLYEDNLELESVCYERFSTQGQGS